MGKSANILQKDRFPTRTVIRNKRAINYTFYWPKTCQFIQSGRNSGWVGQYQTNSWLIIMNRGLLMLAIGSIIVAAVSFYKLSQQRRRPNTGQHQQQPKKTKPTPSAVLASQAHTENQEQSFHEEQDHEDRAIYDKEISEENPHRIVLKKPDLNTELDGVHYDVLLSLNKSKGYEGVVKIRVTNHKASLNSKNLLIDFAGGSILYLAVNSKRIDEDDVVFQNHTILIKKQWLRPSENSIEVIFANRYAFMGDGLTCYFPLDDMNKYSLKEQVIYARNGVNKVANIFPCLNVLNSCQITLQVLHPNGFNAQSNTHKVEMKIVTRKDYPHYQFLFSPTSKALEGSYKLNSSVITETNSYKSTDEIVKAKSQFAPFKLNSIHDFFVFCSAIIEVRPTVNLTSSTSSLTSSAEKALKDVLIRYFSKERLAKKASSFVNTLESQIIDILIKIQCYRQDHKLTLKYNCKIDIFFIDDVMAEGDFYSGAILLSEQAIQRGIIDRRLYFLLCRAFVGTGLLAKKHQTLLQLEGLLQLNQLTLEIFPQCSDYIYVKNKQYEPIRNQSLKLVRLSQQQSQPPKSGQPVRAGTGLDMGFWLMEYYEKQSRYFIKDYQQIQKNISLNVRNIVDSFHNLNSQEYWNFFIARYPLIDFNVSEVLIKLSLKRKGVPKNQAELKYAKDNFTKSKYYLKFFTLDEIQNDLKRFMQLQSHGIQKVLPFIKMRQSYLSFLPRNLEAYIYVKQNRLESKKLYQQFKRYNESNNFHHISALRREIKRIKLLARESISGQRKDIRCGLLSWKLLQKLMIMPLDDQVYKLISYLEQVKKDKFIQQGQKANFQNQEQLINKS